jgi:phosphatidylglycerophosphatase C
MSIRRATLQDVVQHCDRLAQQGQRLRPGQLPIAALNADGIMRGRGIANLLWERLTTQRALNRRSVVSIARAVRECGGDPVRDPYADYASLLGLQERGLVPEETMVRVRLAGLAGMREEDLSTHSSEVADSVTGLDGPGDAPTRRMLDDLRAQGFRVIVVSGSPRWAVEAALRPLGIVPQDVLAGQVAVVEGVLTDGIIEPLPWGKGKVQAILRRFGAVPRVSMGNGLGDLPMLEATSHLRILVNPTNDLVIACQEMKGATWSMDLLGKAPAAKKRAMAAAATAGQPESRPSRRPTAQT